MGGIPHQLGLHDADLALVGGDAAQGVAQAVQQDALALPDDLRRDAVVGGFLCELDKCVCNILHTVTHSFSVCLPGLMLLVILRRKPWCNAKFIVTFPPYEVKKQNLSAP